MSLRSAIVTGIALLAVPAVLATAGFAEWQVRTPGGHLISHIDGFKEDHGDCLRSESRVWVSHIKRWRYYDGWVLGENDDGFFLFDESREVVSRFDDETSAVGVLQKQRAGTPIAGWLTGPDGWREAWFPVVVWGHCQKSIETNTASPMGLSVDECRQALAPSNLKLMRRTTWGHECGKLDLDSAPEPFVGFCRALMQKN